MPFPLSAVDMVVRTNWSDLLEVESPPAHPADGMHCAAPCGGIPVLMAC